MPPLPERRQIGGTEISLSTVVFGTMRFDEKRLPPRKAEALLAHMVDRGTTSFHTSHEYPAHPYFIETLRRLKQARPSLETEHVIKIGVPHFDEDAFKPEKLEQLIERARSDLNRDRIDLVQWMVRHNPNDDEHRLPMLERMWEELAATIGKLKSEGKLGAFACFPYSPAFASKVLDLPGLDGIIDYFNPAELESECLFDELERRSMSFVGIRPLLRGLVLGEGGFSIDECMRLALSHPAVTASIATWSSIDHGNELLDAAADVRQSKSDFKNLLTKARRLPPIIEN